MEAHTTFSFVDSPIGRLLLVAGAEGLEAIGFQDGPRAMQPEAGWQEAEATGTGIEEQLDAYFDGQLRDFDVSLAPRGTPFQLRVWEALCEVPYGETTTYGAIARRIGKPKAVRAVGAANGRNPLPIVVPCHRIIGHDGSLTGYGGGLPIKKALLALERRHKPMRGGQGSLF